MKKLSFLLLAFLMVFKLTAQNSTDKDAIHSDSLAFIPLFNTTDAWNYVDYVVKTNSFWRSQQDTLRSNLQRLLDHSTEHFDSTRSKLLNEDLSLIEVQKGDPVVIDSIELKWLNDSTFLIDPHGWSSDLYLDEESSLIYPEVSQPDLPVIPSDSINLSDVPELIPDTVIITLIDTAAIESLGIAMYSFRGNQISPPLDKEGLIGVMTADRSRVNYYSPGTTWMASEASPFKVVESEYHLDSLQFALKVLLEFTSERDSSILWVNDIFGDKTPFWLSSGDEKAYRYWVKNFNNDSITLWIGNPAPNEISLLLEEDVSINRLMKEDIHHLPQFVLIPDRTLVPMKELEEHPIYWDFAFSSAFTLNQTYLSNWTKGGESSFASVLDILGESTYNNKDAQTQWISTMRVNFGTIRTKENGYRKNQDLIEVNSKYNRNAWGKIGASASFYMKTQMAYGYNYPNDSVVISKFLNPASLTVGLGFEYKPIKNTTINVAPLSFKNTFVTDTALIDQTIHGIPKDKRAKQEMGTQIVINNKFNPTKNLKIENRLRLFSNYLDNPQNVDVDWELILDQKINWFFTIRLNLHLIYDDDVRFPVFDTEGDPVQNPDGTDYTIAQTQFREFIGLSLQFNF